jgi:hypothetical protein
MEMTFADLFIQKTVNFKNNESSESSEHSEDYDYEHLETIEKLLESDTEEEEIFNHPPELTSQGLASQGLTSQGLTSHDFEQINNFDELTSPASKRSQGLASQGLTSQALQSQGLTSQDVRKSWILEKYQTGNISSDKKNSKYKLINRRIDFNRIRHKKANNLEVHTSVCKNIRIDFEGPIRSGAIIYTHHLGKTYFCMGIDSCYGDLTDFAGGVKKGESILTGGLRELHEESLGIFGELGEKDIAENLSFYSNNMVIMFIRLAVDIEKTKNDFSNLVKEKEDGHFANKLEVSNICWLDKGDFLDSIACKGRKMYNRVQKILSKVTEIISAL